MDDEEENMQFILPQMPPLNDGYFSICHELQTTKDQQIGNRVAHFSGVPSASLILQASQLWRFRRQSPPLLAWNAVAP